VTTNALPVGAGDERGALDIARLPVGAAIAVMPATGCCQQLANALEAGEQRSGQLAALSESRRYNA
jgi:hypothetical protein